MEQTMTVLLKRSAPKRSCLQSLMCLTVLASHLGAQHPAFDDFRAAFVKSAAAATGDAAIKRWDSTAVFIRRSWALHAMRDGIRLSAPTMNASLRNASLPADQIKPVDLILRMQL